MSRVYRQSKLANLVYARELAKRYPNITTVSLHPGVVATAMLAGQKLSSKVFMTVHNLFLGVTKMNEDEGVLNQVRTPPLPFIVLDRKRSAHNRM